MPSCGPLAPSRRPVASCPRWAPGSSIARGSCRNPGSCSSPRTRSPPSLDARRGRSRAGDQHDSAGGHVHRSSRGARNTTDDWAKPAWPAQLRGVDERPCFIGPIDRHHGQRALLVHGNGLDARRPLPSGYGSCRVRAPSRSAVMMCITSRGWRQKALRRRGKSRSVPRPRCGPVLRVRTLARRELIIEQDGKDELSSGPLSSARRFLLAEPGVGRR